MLIYNVTTKVAWSVHEAWATWMLEVHIPDLMATGCFQKFQLTRLLETDEEEGPTYATQYYTDNRSNYENYIANYSTEMRNKVFEKWGNSVFSFRSLMEIIA